MAGIITLLIKTNVMLAALCLLYLALFRRDTFFSWRRASLLFIYTFIILFAIASNMQWSVASPVAGSKRKQHACQHKNSYDSFTHYT